MEDKGYNDKDLVIMAVIFIVLGAMAIPGVPDSAIGLAEKALYGLFGIAVGRAAVKNGG